MTFFERYHTFVEGVVEEYPVHHILLFGRPGAGKGTMARVFRERGYSIIGVGQLIRKHIHKESHFSERLKREMGARLILPDDLANDLILPEVEKALTEGKQIVLDNYPVTDQQLATFCEYVRKVDLKILVIYLEVSEAEAVDRLLQRRTCLRCHLSYPPEMKTCKECGQDLGQRYDDTPEIIKERQRQYNEITAPLLRRLRVDFRFLSYKV